MKGRIIFISNSVYPTADSGGGSVVVYRHLKRFEKEGKEVVIINSLPNKSRSSEFKEIYLDKKQWYPPIRKNWPILTNIRVWLEVQYILKKLKPTEGDVVLSILGDYTNLLALQISKRYTLPLHMIYHDDSLFNRYERENTLTKSHVKAIVKKVNCFYAVSKPMQTLLIENGAELVKLLYPIPEGNILNKLPAWKPSFEVNLELCYAGMLLEDAHFDILKKVSDAISYNGIFTILTNVNPLFEKKISHSLRIKIEKQILNKKELFEYLISNFSSLLVFYSFDSYKEPRMCTSFPSKFCEFVHLGLPIILIAPTYSAIGKWAIENN